MRSSVCDWRGRSSTCGSSRCRATAIGPCCCTGTSTSSPRWSAGALTAARGRRSSRTASSMAAAAPTTDTRSSAALSALGALAAQGVAHARCIGVIETCEESGSYDLPAYLDALQAAPRQRRLRHRPRLRMRRLRTPVDDDVAARSRRRQADRRSADRRRALRRCERRRAVVVSHRAQAPRPSRGFGNGLDNSVDLSRADSTGARRSGSGSCCHSGRHRLSKIPVCRRHAADDR